MSCFAPILIHCAEWLSVELPWKQVEVSRRSSRSYSTYTGAECNADWLNDFLTELWPRISAHVTAMLKDSVEPKIQEALPSVLGQSFRFSEVTLGDKPLQLDSIRESANNYQSRTGTVRDVFLKLDVVYEGDAHVQISAAGAKLGIHHLTLTGDLQVCFKELMDRPPFFTGISIFFANTPKIDMKWTGAAKVLAIGKLKHTIQRIISQQLDHICVLPRRIAIEMDHTEDRLFRLKAPWPIGILRLHLIGARDLQAMDWSLFGQNTSDPYATMRLGGITFTSKVINKNLNPRWNETHTFLVFDRHQKLDIELYDSDMNADDFLGQVELKVDHVLQKCRAGPEWFTLKSQPDASAVVKELNGAVWLDATLMDVHLSQDRARAIATTPKTEHNEHIPRSLVFVGLYSIKLPPVAVGTQYLVEATCHGFTQQVQKTASVPQEDAAMEIKRSELVDKIEKLRSLKVSDADIAEVLSIPVAALAEKDPSAQQYSNVLRLEEPFFFFADIPEDTVVKIQVSSVKPKAEIGSVDVPIDQLLNVANCTVRHTVKSGDIKVEYLAQVRVIEEPFQDCESP